MTTTINNEWITLPNLFKGVQVQRKFAGLNTMVGVNDAVEKCEVYYWHRELYPNGDVIKTELKWYNLEDLAYTEIDVNGVLYYMEPLAVLTGFVETLGYPGIINPARETLENDVTLPPDSPNGYQLRLNTRPQFLYGTEPLNERVVNNTSVSWIVTPKEEEQEAEQHTVAHVIETNVKKENIVTAPVIVKKQSWFKRFLLWLKSLVAGK